MTSVAEYDYELPAELIAQRPLSNRADARLLVVHRDSGELEHTHVRELPRLLRRDDILVLNDTKVLPARLVGYRVRTRGRWQGLVLSTDRQGMWKLLGRTRGKLEEGESIMLIDRNLRDHTELTLVARLDDGQWAARPKTTLTNEALLNAIGRVPLPHYIRDGEMIDADTRTYQTVYATRPGSVAAPTAGLHFTPELFTSLEQSGIRTVRVTLHVGLGTFRPIATAELEGHVMHEEPGEITAAVAEELNAARARGGRIIAVGTTSVRVLESAASDHRLRPWHGLTRLFIHPPYTFQAVDGLLTNFHLPRSTLLVLVRTFGGSALIRRAYEAAIADHYRFYSYGDAMLVL